MIDTAVSYANGPLKLAAGYGFVKDPYYSTYGNQGNSSTSASGTFDNMNHFFSNNGYRVIDRTAMDQAAFSNIWGVSDEDLFRNALGEFDAQHARGERIFAVLMTTSNHKPFTFPAGVRGVKPSGGGGKVGLLLISPFVTPGSSDEAGSFNHFSLLFFAKAGHNPPERLDCSRRLRGTDAKVLCK